MKFEWDERKRLATIGKHRLDFDVVRLMWRGPVIDPFERRSVDGEARIVALGVAGADEKVIAVVYSWRDGARRLISARRARAYEREAYATTFGRGC